MSAPTLLHTAASGWIVWIAGGLTVLWAAFWTWFGLASGLGDRLSVRGVLLHAAAPGLLVAAGYLMPAGARFSIGTVALVPPPWPCLRCWQECCF